MEAAAAERWWPACSVGHYDTPACLRVQDHSYDFVLPMAPWVPVGHAAVLAGLSLLLLGAAVAALPLLLRPRRRPAYVWLLCAALGASQLLAGVSTLGSGLLGRPGQAFWAPFVIFVWLGWPVALTLTSILMIGHVRRPGTGWLLLIVLLTASTPLVQAFLTPAAIGYTSYDMTPWSEAWGGACLLLAALAVWPAAYRRRRRPAPVVAAGSRGRPVAAGS
jgi:hypothetical protein